MTREEEAIERIKMILEEATANEDAVCYVTSDDADVLDMAIKALKQMTALEKIRAEIKKLPITDTAIRLACEIIDKYKE